MMYLIQVSICWILFFGIYLAFFRKETFFGVNRMYLIGTLLAGLAIPYLGALLPANDASIEIFQAYAAIQISDVPTVNPAIESSPIITIGGILLGIYVLGILLLGSRMLYGLLKIRRIYNSSSITPYEKYTLVESDAAHLPFSFFHLIFISKKIPLKSDVSYIIKHEELHINQWHTIDVLFLELLQVFFWFNPILILYKKAIRQAHEYLADSYVTEEYNKQSYGQLLLRQSTSGVEIALSNQFFHSQIKQRITMMYQEKSKKSAMIKYLAALPVLAAMLFLFSSSKMDKSTTEYAEASVIENTENNTKVSPTKEIQLDKEGKLYHDNQEIAFQDLIKIIENCKSDNHFLGLDIEQETMMKHINPILDAAADKGVKVVLLSEDDNKRKDNNFDGRRIIERPSPKELFNKMKSLNLKGAQTITLLAEANEGGDVTYVEVLSDETTIDNKEVLKDALRLAKNYKIEASSKKSSGHIVFNLDLINDLKEGSESLFGLRSKLNFDENGLSLSQEDEQGDPVFKVVEEMPRFPGCEEMNAPIAEKEECAKQKMLEFINANVKYPETARKKGTEGMVIAQFIIEKDGTVSDLKIARKVEDGCSEAAIAALEKMPTWVPGKQQGKAVRVQYTLPVKFKLQGDPVPPSSPKPPSAPAPPSVDGPLTKIPPPPPPTVAKAPDAPAAPEQPDDVFRVVEQMPRFPGCEDMKGTQDEIIACAQEKLLQFIFDNLEYPKEAIKKGTEGMTVLEFIVTKEGHLTDVKTLRNIGDGCGAESIRVVESMPTWIPGVQQGKKVAVRYVLPIKYKLESDASSEKRNNLSNDINAIDKNKLMQNVPNPFRENTVIGFELEQAGDAKLTIYNIPGEAIKIINIKAVKGYNEVTIEAKDLNATGVLYYTLDSGDFSTTKKMVKL